jgi:hypothetical protein
LTIDELRLLIFDLSCRQILPLPFKNPKSTIVTRKSIPLPLKVTQARDEKGLHRCFQYKSKDMPGRFWPGQSLLTRFDLTRDGKRIPIAERFWNDLAGLRIQTSTLDPEKLAPQLQWKAQQFLTGLWRPRLSPSAEDDSNSFRFALLTSHSALLPHPLDRQQVRHRPPPPPLPAA